MPLFVTRDNVYERIGWISDSRNHDDLSRPVNVDGDPFALILFWKKKAYFDLNVTTLDEDEREGDKFISDPRELAENVLKRVGRGDATFPPQFLQENCVIGGVVRRGQELRFEIRVNTDDALFCKEAGECAANNAPLKLDVNAAAICGAQSEQDHLLIELGALGRAPFYDGFAALDLGNTNNAVACLPGTPAPRRSRGEQEQAVSIRDQSGSLLMLPDVAYEVAATSSLQTDSTSIPSMVRIDRMVDITSLTEDQRARALDPIDTVTWRIGSSSRMDAPKTDGLVMGPKRLVSRQPDADKCTVVADDLLHAGRSRREISVKIENWIPAELLICRIMQILQSVTRARPEELAVTYPTTYSSWELRCLKLTVYRAWLRAQNRSQSDLERLRDSTIDEFAGLTLDEATAAAFFFLYREVFKPAGALQRFRYLYPNGYTLLLYDCGGGTTDIALLKASAPSHNRLEFSVRGRSGLRDLGGDNITEAVFQILKAKLAYEIQELGGQQASGDDLLEPCPRISSDAEGSKLENHFRWHRDAIDRLVPTRFDRNVLDQGARRRQRNAVALWLWAERVKYALSEGRETVHQLAQYDQLVEYLAHGDSQARHEIFERAQEIKVHRVEVDSLIREKVLDSVRCCNSLIDSRLGQTGEELNAVFVVGKASCYPLVRQLLVEHLDVPFLTGDSPRFHFEQEHLKNAVAKGAALALAMLRGSVGVHLGFDKELSKRLPFDIGYLNAATGTVVDLYQEGQAYDKLEEKRIELRPRQDQQGPDEDSDQPQLINRIRLLHRWPGGGYTDFLKFHFQRGVEEAVSVYYDTRTHDFWASDGHERVKATRDISDDVYRSPVQRGDL